MAVGANEGGMGASAVGQLLTAGGKLQLLEHARRVSREQIPAMLGQKGYSADDACLQACLAVAGSPRPGDAAGPFDDSVAVARRAGWPKPDELTAFEQAVETCPLELIRATLWVHPANQERELPAPRCIARLVLANRLTSCLSTADTSSPEFQPAAIMFAEDLCARFLPPLAIATTSWHLVESDAGEHLARRVTDLLERLARERRPPYLADALHLSPLHAYNALARRIREYEVKQANGALHAFVLRLQHERSRRFRITRRDDSLHEAQVHSDQREAVGQVQRPNLPPHLLAIVRRACRRFFHDLPRTTQQVLILKSLTLEKDGIIGAALGIERETANRAWNGAKKQWPAFLQRELGSWDWETYSASPSEWEMWHEMLPTSEWPEIPKAARALVAQGLTRDFEELGAFVREEPSATDLLIRTLIARDGDLLTRPQKRLRALRSSISEFKRRRAREQEIDAPAHWIAFDAEFILLLGGFYGVGCKLTHVIMALRIFAGLGTDERWLIANAKAPLSVKREHVGANELESAKLALRKISVLVVQRDDDALMVWKVLEYLASEDWTPY